MYESKSGGPESEIKTAAFAIRIKTPPFCLPNAGDTDRQKGVLNSYLWFKKRSFTY